MNKEDALELIERMPFITTIKAPHRKARIEYYQISAESDDPVEWIKVVKSCYVGMHYGGMSVCDEELRYADLARTRLEGTLAHALEIGQDEVEAYINRHIGEMI